MASIPLPALDLKPAQQSDPLGDVSKLMALKSMMTQQASQQQELQIRQQQIKDTQARTAAMKGLDPNSATYYDDLAKRTLENGGSADAATAIQQHGLTLKKTASDIAKQDAETGSKNLETFTKKFQFVGDQLTEEKDIPDSELHNWALSKVGQFQQGGLLAPPQAQQFAQQIQQTQDPAHLRQLIQQTAKSAAGAKYIGDQAKTEAETNKNTAQAGEATAAAEQKRQESQWYKDHGVGAPGVAAGTVSMSDWLSKHPGQGPSDYEIAMKKVVPAFNFNLGNAGTTGDAGSVAKRFGMTPTAFDQAAEKYWTSGALPPSGRGGPALALNKAIMNRTAELHPEGSLAANSAEFKANSASLGKIQTNFDQVSAFENTANKNLDLFLDKLSKIPDLGVKFLNTPLRKIDASMIGSDNYQAMKAAQQTAATETAKVLASANASGVLSDTQKKDAEDVLSGNLSYSAAKAVVETLKQDFGNRHQSYANQIADIKGRLGQKGATEQAAPPAANPTAGAFNWGAMPEHK